MQYVAGGNAEPFDRTLEEGRDKTRNDFFNRSITYANIPKLPFPIPENVKLDYLMTCSNILTCTMYDLAMDT